MDKTLELGGYAVKACTKLVRNAYWFITLNSKKLWYKSSELWNFGTAFGQSYRGESSKVQKFMKVQFEKRVGIGLTVLVRKTLLFVFSEVTF